MDSYKEEKIIVSKDTFEQMKDIIKNPPQENVEKIKKLLEVKTVLD